MFKLFSSDLNHLIKLCINSLWQLFWDFRDTFKLHSIQQYDFHLKHSYQVIISRFRIGHSMLTRTYLLKGEQQPECIFCDCPLTLYHLFFECSYTLPPGTYSLCKNFLTAELQLQNCSQVINSRVANESEPEVCLYFSHRQTCLVFF